MKLGDLAARLGGALVGDPGVEITGVGDPEGAGPGMIVYAAAARALRTAEAGGAAALLLPPELEPRRLPAIRVQNARLAFAHLLELFAPPPSSARTWGWARACTSAPTSSSVTARVSARARRYSQGRW